MIFILTLVVMIWNCAFCLHRPPPRYSQQYMPQTSFTCRNKIVGSYYADPETDCQLFHVCVAVAGNIQDYRFLCPNDTAFDQESQTCADWYDVDCEAATLYYASDNFDLYRIGSGLESLHYDNIRSDFEPQDHLQRSESNDPIRSSLNSFNLNNHKGSDLHKNNNVRANENSNEFTSKKQKYTNLESEKNSKDNQESEKKNNLRKINRKAVANDFTSTYTTKSTTFTPLSTQNYYDVKSIGHNFGHLTTSQRLSMQHFFTSPKFKAITSTLRPTTKYLTINLKSIGNSEDIYTNYQTMNSKTNLQNNFNDFNRFETTAKSIHTINTQYSESSNYSGQFSQGISLTTKQPISEYHGNNYEQKAYNNYNNKHNNSNNNNNNYNNTKNHNYNNFQKENISYIISTTSSNIHGNYKSNNNNYNFNSYTINTYAPTTYAPSVKKIANNRQYNDKYTTLTTKSIQHTEPDLNKISKKITHQKIYPNYQTSTKNYDFGKSSIGFGFSPSSVNKLAENFKSTTPTSRRAASPTTYNPNNFNTNTHVPENQMTQQKSMYYQNISAKQYYTTKFFDETTIRPKLTKKNDYDYAYYDNGPVEYDSIELEHVNSNSESVKIT